MKGMHICAHVVFLLEMPSRDQVALTRGTKDDRRSLSLTILRHTMSKRNQRPSGSNRQSAFPGPWDPAAGGYGSASAQSNPNALQEYKDLLSGFLQHSTDPSSMGNRDWTGVRDQYATQASVMQEQTAKIMANMQTPPANANTSSSTRTQNVTGPDGTVRTWEQTTWNQVKAAISPRENGDSWDCKGYCMMSIMRDPVQHEIITDDTCCWTTRLGSETIVMCAPHMRIVSAAAPGV